MFCSSVSMWNIASELKPWPESILKKMSVVFHPNETISQLYQTKVTQPTLVCIVSDSVTAEIFGCFFVAKNAYVYVVTHVYVYLSGWGQKCMFMTCTWVVCLCKLLAILLHCLLSTICYAYDLIPFYDKQLNGLYNEVQAGIKALFEKEGETCSKMSTA